MRFIQSCKHIKVKILIDKNLFLHYLPSPLGYRPENIPIIKQRFVYPIYHFIIKFSLLISVIITAHIIAKLLVRSSSQFFTTKGATPFNICKTFHTDGIYQYENAYLMILAPIFRAFNLASSES